MKRYYLNNYDTTAARDITVIIAVNTFKRSEVQALKKFRARYIASGDPEWDFRKVSKSSALCGMYEVKTAAEFFGC